MFAMAATANAAGRADIPDLNVTVGAVTFGAGSVVGIESLRLTNVGSAPATGVSLRIELLRDTTAKILDFTVQRQGCTMESVTVVTCRTADVGELSSTAVRPFYLPAIEFGGGPGGAPVAMPLRLRITASSQQPDPTPADNTGVSTSFMRTVESGSSDWSAVAIVDRNDSDYYYIRLASLGSAGTGEVVHTYRAPAGTEWLKPFPYPCLEIRSRVEYRCSSTVSTAANLGTGPVTYDYRFLVLKIVGPITADGEYRVDPLAGDPNPVNNSARIALGVGPSGTSTNPAALPATGDSVVPIAVAGIGAVAVGTALIFLVRRRRQTL